MQLVKRRLVHAVQSMLSQYPAVVVTGARQVGKTTLARAIVPQRDCVFYNLGNSDLRKHFEVDAVDLLASHRGKLVIIDEAQMVPSLFRSLRVAIDCPNHDDRGPSKFLLTGSARAKLLTHARGALGSRAAYLTLHGFDWLEMSEHGSIERLWERGGYPPSYLAATEEISSLWRDAHLEGAIATDFKDCGFKRFSQVPDDLLIAIAEGQGNSYKMPITAGAFGTTQSILEKCLDIFETLKVVRRLPAHARSAGSCAALRPKVYLCDSGLFHELSGFAFGNPKRPGYDLFLGASWEGFVLENLMAVLPSGWSASYYRDRHGHEVNLVLERPCGELWAVDITSGTARTPSRQLNAALAGLRPERAFQVYRRGARKQPRGFVEALPLAAMMTELLQHNRVQCANDSEEKASSVVHDAAPRQKAEPLAGLAADQANRHCIAGLHVFADGAPLPGAEVSAMQPDKSWVHAVTDENGIACLRLHSDEQPLVVCAAGDGFGKVIEHGWIPSKRALVMHLPTISGSIAGVIHDPHGDAQGVRRRAMDGILWTNVGRISIGASRPMQFEFGEDAEMLDSQVDARVLFVKMKGPADLIDFLCR